MNQLIENRKPTMSSREIAELVGSRPADVNRSIDRLISRGVIDAEPVYAEVAQVDPLAEMTIGKAAKLFGLHRSSIYESLEKDRIPYRLNKQGHKVVSGEDMVALYGQPDAVTPVAQGVGGGVYEYMLDKRNSLVVVAQLCPEFTAAIVDRWQELEEKEAESFSIKQPSRAELILMQAQALVEHERRIDELEREQEEQRGKMREAEIQLRAITEGDEYFTVSAYCTIKSRNVDTVEAARIGRRATWFCESQGWHMGRVKHPRFGYVKTYPVEALDMAVTSIEGAA